MPVAGEFKQMWSEAFGDSKSWIDFFFERACSQEDIVMLHTPDDVSAVSALLLRRYSLNFHGSMLPVAYLCGANTRRKYRGRGYMGQLMRHALKVAYDRGDAVVTLIPATARLYEFYRQFGFAKAVYAGVKRYTALHPFNTAGEYHAVHSPAHPAVADTFCHYESRIPGRVLHTPSEYLNILEDVRLDGGDVAVVADDMGVTVGFAFGVHYSDGIIVKDVIAKDDDAADGALRELRRMNPNVPFKVVCMPEASTRSGMLTSVGMARIVNPLAVLERLAREHRKWRCRIRLTDSLLPVNTGTYTIESGNVVFDPGSPGGRPDYDVDSEVFTLLVFASPHMGDLIGFPSQRLYQALLLE